MAMNVGPRDGDDEVMIEINTTPLIDVMLVLLIMLIITIPIQTHAVKLDLPTGAPPPPAPVPPTVVSIDVDFDGTIYWDGNVLPDRAALDAHFQGIAAEAVQPELHVRPNRLAPYKFVAEILADAQRLGVTKLGLVGNEQLVE